MPAWAKLAWVNRARIVAFSKKLHWSRRTWMRVLALAAVGLGVYLAATHGYLERWNPTTFSNAQWAQLLVNVIGFGFLYVAARSWWGRQDAVWDEVDVLSRQVDELRVALSELKDFAEDHEHDVVEAEDRVERQEELIHLAVSRLPVPEPATAQFAAVRQAPISDRDRPTVTRTIGGRTFQFAVDE